MADFDASKNAAENLGNPRIITQIFDASKTVLAQNETAAILNIPARSSVQEVFWEVLTVEGSAKNFSIGDAADPDGWVLTTSGNSVASGIGGGSYAGGKHYGTATQLNLTADTSGGLTKLKLKVSALLVTY